MQEVGFSKQVCAKWLAPSSEDLKTVNCSNLSPRPARRSNVIFSHPLILFVFSSHWILVYVQELEQVEHILGLVLLIGNLTFLQAGEAATHYFDLDIHGPLVEAAHLLGCDVNLLGNSLTTSLIVMRGETIVINNTMASACDARDAMAKALYGRLFSWITNKVNALLARPRPEDAHAEPLVAAVSTSIGVLDIFGFESVGTNSLEQLCINVANEQLQFFFNKTVFAWQQRELEGENIQVDLVQFVDNGPILQLFLATPIGLFSLLDEESRFPKASDETLCQKLRVHMSASPYFFAPEDTHSLDFTVLHFAGHIRYSTMGWLEKNRDSLTPSITSLLREAELPLVAELFSLSQTVTGGLVQFESESKLKRRHSDARKLITVLHDSLWHKDAVTSNVGPAGIVLRRQESLLAMEGTSRRFPASVTAHFKASLANLMATLSSSHPWFLRCIQPNHKQLPETFDRTVVATQLKHTGMLETIRIRAEGYAVHLAFATFLAR